MRTITDIREMLRIALQLKREGKTIGFVPTMGYLHEGHLSLLQNARKENDVTVVSIFVNPLQFGPKEDLATYPRDLERDSSLAEKEGCDYLFFPSAEDMYPAALSVTAKVQERTDVLCGKSRPGHFDGVATVLIKLFNIVQPDKVYFGMKDAQQVAVVDGLVRDLNIPVEIIPVQTVREEDGLAKSSRNVHLLPAERDQASALYKSLIMAETLIAEGEYDPARILRSIREFIEKNTSGEIDYIEILSYPDLKQLSCLEEKIIIAMAVKFKKARLIDNAIISVKKES
ncbi:MULTISPECIES: pantoate--beta-alanine ligase [Cytobacillus]|uniref:pantoate--beta-alanine ligase n=1 Tax=Cytobacillus TaxID=2675230 RepID=UPI001D14C8F5|nr:MULTISPECIES: pantoate--beta-alanine ligase [Cytobacillus]MCC3647903.1 pantoate--beta-alanine ligase [Cytobacillus oceanisediminis]MCS0653999.1 pantoate--beta-alanine ligase [Cytobacillus firmus]MCU1805809.1 pantoate--beta-alanine ligase [Cytobacillus firmus]